MKSMNLNVQSTKAEESKTLGQSRTTRKEIPKYITDSAHRVSLSPFFLSLIYFFFDLEVDRTKTKVIQEMQAKSVRT